MTIYNSIGLFPCYTKQTGKVARGAVCNMKLYVPKEKHTLTIRIVILLLVAIIPLTVIYYRAFFLSQQIVQNEMSESLARQNQDFMDRLRADTLRIQSTTHMLASNWEIGKLGVVPDTYSLFEKAQALQNIQDKIYLAQINSRFIESINVYFPAMDKSVATNLTASTLQTMRDITKNIADIPHDIFTYYDGQMILVSEITFNEETGVPNLVMCTVLSERELKLFFQGNNNRDIVGTDIFSVQEAEWLRDDQNTQLQQFLENQVKSQLADDDDAFQTSDKFKIRFEGREYVVIYSYLSSVDVVLMQFYKAADMALVSTQMMRSFLWLFAVVAALVFLWIYFAFRVIVDRPLKRLMKAFQQVEGGDLQLPPHTDEKGEFAYIFKGFDSMLLRLHVLLSHTYWQGQMVKRAEFKQLQAQIDPHFLYNGFFILNKRIRARDFTGALSFSKLLSDYFRYITQNTQDSVSLQSEMQHAYNYVNIQQERFKNRLKLDIMALPEAYYDVRIPRLVLQPVCENVFKHVLDQSEIPLTLRIRYQTVLEQLLIITVEDSGQRLTDETLASLRESFGKPMDDGEISGLTNVDKRLRLFYGETYGVSVERSTLGGLLVCLYIDAGRRDEAV